jgi:hypothetical protein
MLPDFKSKILTQLLAEQKEDGPLLLNLMGQCFQDVGLTKWTSGIAKRCPNNADHMKANFYKCIKDYIEAIAGFSNVGDQLICWLCTAKKPTLMPMHKFMWHRVQLLSYLRVAISIERWKCPWHKQRVNKYSSRSPRRINSSSRT